MYYVILPYNGENEKKPLQTLYNTSADGFIVVDNKVPGDPP